MTPSPTPAELAALRVANAAVRNSSSPNSHIIDTAVFALGAAQLLQSPETAAELVALRKRVAELEALTPAPIQDCQICGAGYTYGEPCSVCEYEKRVAAATASEARPETSSPWERAVAGLNALVDADVVFHVEPDGHISAPFSDERIEWDLKAKRWVLTRDTDGCPTLPEVTP